MYGLKGVRLGSLRAPSWEVLRRVGGASACPASFIPSESSVVSREAGCRLLWRLRLHHKNMKHRFIKSKTPATAPTIPAMRAVLESFDNCVGELLDDSDVPVLIEDEGVVPEGAVDDDTSGVE